MKLWYPDASRHLNTTKKLVQDFIAGSMLAEEGTSHEVFTSIFSKLDQIRRGYPATELQGCGCIHEDDWHSPKVNKGKKNRTFQAPLADCTGHAAFFCSIRTTTRNQTGSIFNRASTNEFFEKQWWCHPWFWNKRGRMTCLAVVPAFLCRNPWGNAICYRCCIF